MGNTARGYDEEAMSLHRNYHQRRRPIVDSVTTPSDPLRLQTPTMPAYHSPPAQTLVPSLSRIPSDSSYALPGPILPRTNSFPSAPKFNQPSAQGSQVHQSSFDIGVPPSSPYQPQIVPNPFGAYQNPFGVHQNPSFSQVASHPPLPSTLNRPWKPHVPLSIPSMMPISQPSTLEDIKPKQVLDICKDLQNLYENPFGKEFDIYDQLLNLKSHVSPVFDDERITSNDLGYFLHFMGQH